MPLELWIAYTVGTIMVLAVPGPTVMLVVSYALGQGRATGWATVPGVMLGDFVAMTVSLLGAGAVLATSATLFTGLKLAGAAYLVWLGIKLWRVAPTLEALENTVRPRGGRAMFWHAFVVTALNPKSIVFFIAFVPLFLAPNRPAWPQFVILEATFVVLAAINVAIWAVLAGELRARLASPRVLKTINRTGGTLLIGAGALTALARRGA